METNSNTPTNGKLIGASGKIYHQSPRFDHWFRLVTDEKSRETFGNFTKSAAVAYQLDLTDPKQYNIASSVGSQNYKKLKDLGSIIMQKKGVTFAFWIDVLVAKMANSQSSTWWEIVGEMMGYRERKPVQVNQNNQYNVYNGITDEQLTDQYESNAAETFHEETLAQILIEGDVSAGEEQIPFVEVHPEELRNEDTPNQSLPEPQSTV